MPKFSANLSLLYSDPSFLDRFEAAAQAGFKAVEFWFSYRYLISDIQERLSHWNLKCIGINSPPGDMDAGE